MMSKKQWLALLVVFISYLLLGAAIFYHIEQPLEHMRRLQEFEERRHIHKLLKEHYAPNDTQSEILQDLESYCGKPMMLRPENELEQTEPVLWNFYNSFFFVVTVVSTVGYGNLAPTSCLGRILMILYALIGIPMNGILLASLGEFFSNTLLRARRRHKHESVTWLMVDIIRYLVPGFVVFIFLPAAVFAYVEPNWSYDMGVYYAFVTLTTIGFGDIVAGQSSRGQGGVYVLYRIALIVWIVFGLGYLVMLLGFITRAMRSKRMARLEHKLAENLRMTQSRIWHGFTKDMGYLRRVLNEMYLQKLKPVYRTEESYPRQLQRARSNSEPTLRVAVEAEPAPDPGLWRRRANSESVPGRGSSLHRVLSESDLTRIDKDATFATATMIEPAEFLARFVNALGGAGQQKFIEEEDEEQAGGGVQGFSDEEILASEKWGGSGWTLGAGDAPSHLRGRAASEVRIPMPDERSLPSNAEWTWSGAAASRRVHELIRARQSTKSPSAKVSDTKRSSISSLFQLPRWRNPLKKRSKTRSLSDMIFMKRSQSLQEDVLPSKESVATQRNYLTHTAGARNPLQSYLSSSRFSSVGGSNGDLHSVLEETSLADFFRALSSVHSRVEPAQPRRKLGTASLTPPYSSLSSLFTPSAQQALGRRRFSLRPVPVTSSVQAPPALQRRRFSLLPPSARRRSSLRPDVNPPAIRRDSLRTAGTPTFVRGPRRFSVRPVNPRARDLRQELFQRQVTDLNLPPRSNRP